MHHFLFAGHFGRFCGQGGEKIGVEPDAEVTQAVGHEARGLIAEPQQGGLGKHPIPIVGEVEIVFRQRRHMTGRFEHGLQVNKPASALGGQRTDGFVVQDDVFVLACRIRQGVSQVFQMGQAPENKPGLRVCHGIEQLVVPGDEGLKPCFAFVGFIATVTQHQDGACSL